MITGTKYRIQSRIFIRFIVVCILYILLAETTNSTKSHFWVNFESAKKRIGYLGQVLLDMT